MARLHACLLNAAGRSAQDPVTWLLHTGQATLDGELDALARLGLGGFFLFGLRRLPLFHVGGQALSMGLLLDFECILHGHDVFQGFLRIDLQELDFLSRRFSHVRKLCTGQVQAGLSEWLEVIDADVRELH